MTGEGKSLMDQLRGEAMKFHKPGEKEPHEQSNSVVCLPLTLFFHTLYTTFSEGQAT